MTPEARVKKLVSTYLNGLDTSGRNVYHTMFVPVGYGKRNSLDYTICISGRYVGIETKAPGQDLTPTQRLACRDIYKAGGKVFIVSGAEGLDAFKRWVEREHRHIT